MFVISLENWRCMVVHDFVNGSHKSLPFWWQPPPAGPRLDSIKVLRLDQPMHAMVCDLASVGWRIRRVVQSILGILRMKGREEMSSVQQKREMGTQKRR